MPARRIILPLALVIGLGLAFWYWDAGRPPSGPVAAKSVSVPKTTGASVHSAALRAAAPGDAGAASPIADALNAPGGSVLRDLQIVQELLEAWQSNFPRSGNPVGENAEITAALAGDNPLGFAFIARRHAAINTRGEICDRWGTPLRFHQLSGTHMEIRSAGPDRKFATADDAVWPPAGP